MRSRYLALAVLVGLLVYIIFYDKGCSWKEKLKCHGTMFLEGMVGGFIIDCIGIDAGFYYFPRQPFLSLDYFLIVIPCWGVFGLLLNCLWGWFGKEQFLRSMAVSILPMFFFYEGSNLITGSWIYTVPFYVVALGWIPLGWTFAGCNRRRKVIFKIETWKQSITGLSMWDKTMRLGLQMIKIILIVVMFPLMLVALVKIFANMYSLVKAKSSFSVYRDYVKVMVENWLAI